MNTDYLRAALSARYLVGSLLLHLLIIGFFIRLPPSKKPSYKQVKIVQAVAVSQAQSQLQAETVPKITVNQKELVSKVEPVPQKSIRKIEEIALKEMPVKRLKPRPQEEKVLLQVPKLTEKKQEV